MEEQTDAQLVTACLDGDPIAWDGLISRYSNLIYTIPLRFGFTQMQADEMFQQTCITLLEKLDSLRNVERLSAWIVTVTRRHCIHHMRRQRDQQPLEDLELAEDSLSIEQTVMNWEQRQRVVAALQSLDGRCEQLLTQLFLVEPVPSYDDLALMLGIKVGSIGPTRRRCLQKLRERVGE